MKNIIGPRRDPRRIPQVIKAESLRVSDNKGISKKITICK